MPVRARSLLAALSLTFTATAGLAASPAPAAAAAPKVAIIVGPVGGLTDAYRSSANRVADAATAAGATVAKAYSPNATWANVKAAVANANIVVYFGHGNGYPNPYSPAENTDRVNGWGLNRTTSNGDADDWSKTMVYCGERALLGKLTSGDDAVRLTYCGGTSNDGISPAPGFTMVYAQAHYAPGFGERYQESDPIPTLSEGQQRVRNYSYPVLALGARGYFATAYGDADDIVRRVLTEPGTPYGQIFSQGEGYTDSALKTMAHPDVAGAEVWVQKTVIGDSMHFGDPDYWYAFAGDPTQTPDGSGGAPFTDIFGSVFYDDIVWLADSSITGGCGSDRFCPDSPVTRVQMASFIARALDLPAATRDYFWDDGASSGEPDINRLAEAGIAGGCGGGRFCPDAPVLRSEMASFLSRAFGLPPSSVDHFLDDDGSMHEENIDSLADAAIAGGCDASRYCPGSSVTRAQMAAFLHRALT